MPHWTSKGIPRTRRVPGGAGFEPGRSPGSESRPLALTAVATLAAAAPASATVVNDPTARRARRRHQWAGVAASSCAARAGSTRTRSTRAAHSRARRASGSRSPTTRRSTACAAPDAAQRRAGHVERGRRTASPTRSTRWRSATRAGTTGTRSRARRSAISRPTRGTPVPAAAAARGARAGRRSDLRVAAVHGPGRRLVIRASSVTSVRSPRVPRRERRLDARAPDGAQPQAAPRGARRGAVAVARDDVVGTAPSS